MFGNKTFRRDLDIGFKNDTFQLLPAISINCAGGYFEITFGFFTFFIYICYSLHNYDNDLEE